MPQGRAVRAIPPHRGCPVDGHRRGAGRIHRPTVEAALPTAETGLARAGGGRDGSVTVAWEDRRARHTVPMVSHRRDGRGFAPPFV